jgi:hypothetical protein
MNSDTYMSLRFRGHFTQIADKFSAFKTSNLSIRSLKSSFLCLL